MKKEAISVYYPEDKLERAIQDAAKKYSNEWLPAHPCQLAADAISSLKCLDGWNDEDLYPIRTSYFFSPHMTRKKEYMTFVTHLLFLRDILENREINAYLHSPITFLARPIAHYLLHNYPVHIYVDSSAMRSINRDVQFYDVGGMMIVANGQNVKLNESCVVQVVSKDPNLESSITKLKDESGIELRKTAATERELDVFYIDEHERILASDMEVYDKNSRETAVITVVEPGETGWVHVRYDNNGVKKIPKAEFDVQYSVI